MSINYLREKEPVGTLWSLRNLYANTESDVLLGNGDTICDVELMKFIKFSISNGRLINLVVTRMRNPFGRVSMDGIRVTKFSEKPLLNHYVNAGTYFLKRELGSRLKVNFTAKDIEKSILKSQAAKGEVFAYKFNGFWKLIDSPKDYKEIRKIYSDGKER